MIVVYTILARQSLNAQASLEQREQYSDVQAIHYIDSINSLSKNIYANHPDSALVIVDDILNFSQKRNYELGQIRALLVKSKILDQFGNLPESEYLIDRARTLAENTGEEEILIDIFFEKAYTAFKQRDFDKCKTNLSESESRARKTSNEKTLGKIYNLYGHLNRNNIDTALVYYNKALDVGYKTKDTLRIASSLGNIGTMYHSSSGNYDLALEKFEECTAMFEALGNRKAVAIGYLNMGNLYIKKLNYQKAMELQLKNLEIREEIKDADGIISAHIGISGVMGSLKREEDSKEYLRRGIQKSHELGLKRHLPVLLQNLGSKYAEENVDTALHFLVKSQVVAKEINDVHALAFSTFNIGAIYKDQKNYLKAEELMLEAHDLFESIDEQVNIDWLLPRIVELYLEWSNEEQEMNKYDIDLGKMEKMLLTSYNNSQVTNDNLNKEVIFKGLIEVYRRTNNLRAKTRFQDELIQLQDSIFTASQLEVANEWAEKFKTVEKEKEIIALESENAITKIRSRGLQYGLLGTILFFSLLGIFGYKFIHERNSKKRLVEVQEFRSQLSSDLHDDVGSILSGIAMQSELVSMDTENIQESELKEIAESSRSAMEKMRDTVWAIDSRKDKYENLLDRMVDFGTKQLNLKNIKLKVNVNTWEGDKKIHPKIRQNLYLIFKEAITNIVKHSNASDVILNLEHSSKFAKITIHDNGTIIKSNVSDGLGLSNIRKRCESIGAQLEMKTSDGFEIIVTSAI